ncbi:MAG: hypothetical protein U0165_04395 [Polyangiaceae bacterium]
MGLSSSALADEGAPPASSGFQLAFRTGYSLPMGKASGETNGELSKLFGGQVPVIADIGGKLSPNVVLAGYLGIAVGSVGDGLKDTCAVVSCTVVGARLGAEIFYQFSPAAQTNPWIGYGIGLESTSLSASSGGQTVSVTASGPEFAHLMGGVDFRLSQSIGLGPFVDFAVGQYSTVEVKSGTQATSSEISKKAIHEWLSFGLKLAVWP